MESTSPMPARTTSLELRDIAAALVRRDLASVASPFIGIGHERDAANVAQTRSARAAGRTFISTGTVVATILAIPVAAVAIAATVLFTAAALLVTAAALCIGIAGAAVGGALGALGWLARRPSASPRRAAVAGFAVAGAVAGVPAMTAIDKSAVAVTRRLRSCQSGARRLAIVTALIAGGAVSTSGRAAAALAAGATKLTSRTVRRLRRSPASATPAIADMGDVAVTAPEPIAPATAAVATPTVTTAAPAAPAVQQRRVGVGARTRVIVAREVELRGAASPQAVGRAVAPALRPRATELSLDI